MSYTFNRKGQITQAYDKECQRSIFASKGGPEAKTGMGNLLHLYQDWPRDWDAWDIDINYQHEQLQELEASTAKQIPSEAGGLCASLYFAYQVGNASRMEQTITLVSRKQTLELFLPSRLGRKTPNAKGWL